MNATVGKNVARGAPGWRPQRVISVVIEEVATGVNETGLENCDGQSEIQAFLQRASYWTVTATFVVCVVPAPEAVTVTVYAPDGVPIFIWLLPP